MSGRPKVVVVGMGDTGVLVAGHLGRAVDVVGVSTRPALVSGQELGNRLADPEHWRRNYLTPLDRFRRLDRVRIVHGSLTSVDLDDRVVHVTSAAGAPVSLPYDLLVIATGVTNGFWRQPRVQALDGIEAELDEVAARIDAAGSVAVVGGGATGVSAAASLARRHRAKGIHLFFSGDEPLPGYHPKVRRDLVRRLERAGVRLHPGHRAVVPAGFAGDELTTGPIEWSTGQEPFTADLTLWAVGAVTPNTAALPAELLDDDGFVRVDEHLRSPVRPEVFAVGDVAASDPERCSARNWGWRVVARNVRAVAAGKTGPSDLKRFTPPEHRWGSVLGLQDDGMTVYQPNGSSFTVPRWAVQPLLYGIATKVAIYGGVRRAASGTGRRAG